MRKILVIACGAIAKELLRIRDMNQWDHIELQCLSAELHNTPDRRPQLLPVYFKNYKRVVYLAQTESEKLQAMARQQADFLGLDYVYRFYGDGPLSLLLKPELAQEGK